MADAAPGATPEAPVTSPETTPPAAPVTPPVAPKAPDASRLLAEATRREKAVQAEKAAWKKQRAAEEAQWKERIAKAERFEAAKARSKQEPLTALELLDLTYEELSIAQLNDGKPGADLAIRRAEQKIADLEKKIEDDKKSEAEKAKADAEAKRSAAEKATLARWHEQTTKRVVDAGEKYELINALGYAHEVGKMIEDHYDATGEETPWEVAAEKLEAHLQAEQEPAVAEVFKKLTNTKWFKSRFAPVAKEDEKPPRPRRSSDPEVPETRAVRPSSQPASTPPAPTITPRMTSAYANPRSAAAKSRAELRAIAEAELAKG